MNSRICLRISLYIAFVTLPLASYQSLAGEDWRVTNLGSPINTPDYEGFPTITKDRLALFFARASATRKDGTAIETFWDTDDWDIYVATRTSIDAPWSEPRKMPDHINTDGQDHSVSFSPDGHWMYFSSTELEGCGGLDIFRSYREDISDHLGWQAPENLGCDVNTEYDDVCVVYHQEDENGRAGLYFVSNREGSIGSFDPWRIGFDPITNTYSVAEHLEAISSPGFEGHIDPEAGYLWTIRENGLGGSDIWQASRDEKGEFIDPTVLGAPVNTVYEEQMPSPFDHGRAFYFPSDRPGGVGSLDIYVAERIDE